MCAKEEGPYIGVCNLDHWSQLCGDTETIKKVVFLGLVEQNTCLTLYKWSTNSQNLIISKPTASTHV
jgi:hypothetical protein